ncbi:acyl-CoA N-acyltransferase [Vararia minispora EC-137]|uniref:Acyl-CoA N-acyltransferase n=1 Tax=Vararia minispora EC-137 TaxID=1314806 RepID=A0ACB8QU50_9AGAM|nr:acyl-CoA N-acyltransferase [Vararia minispora EC-137]
MPSMFQSARLTYRAPRQDDLDELYEVYNDPDCQLGLYVSGYAPRPEKLKNELKSWSESNLLFVIAVDTQTGEFVGKVMIRFDQPAALRDGELGIVVKKNKWGRGYGTEIVGWAVRHGFRYLNLHRVSLGVFADNDAAIAVYNKTGFVQEGVKRRARFCNGKWGDIIRMGIVEDEFFEREAQKINIHQIHA